jgi:potassium-dependent mechanosensitive channel
VTRVLRRLALAFALLALALPLGRAEQVGPQPSFKALVDEWRLTLDQVQAAISAPGSESESVAEARDRADQALGSADQVLKAAEAARAQAETESKPLRDQLGALGPAPAKGQPPEAPEVASQRRQLVEQIAAADAQIKQAELTIGRANNLQSEIVRITRERIAELLFARQPSPLSRSVLAAATREFGEVMQAFTTAEVAWRGSGLLSRLEPVIFTWLGLALILGLGAGWPLRNWLLRRFGRRPGIAEPSYARRVLAAGVEGLARGLLPAAGLVALVAVLVGEEVVTGLLARAVEGVLLGITFFSLTSALARAALSPKAPQWRIAPFGAEASSILAGRMSALAAASGIALAIAFPLTRFEPLPLELLSLFRLVFDSALAGLALTLLQHRLWLPDQEPSGKAAAEPKRPRWSWPLLRLLVGFALLAVPLAALAGYVNLASFIVTRIVISGALIGILVLLRTLLREVLAVLIAPESPRSTRLRRALSLTDQGAQILIFWLDAALDLVLLAVGLALVLWLWGASSAAIGTLVGHALSGFFVGNIRISLSDIVLAIVVFAVFLAGTRLVQRLLREKLLPQTRLDSGVRDSFAAFVGYVGFVVAAAFAISTLGLSLSNIAIIAGALSVGIGFGLQNIVNNFVSGLILLVERPIKVGDWVVVGQHQGYVTRISVRATEVETFERASVIIPNSELLSGAVVNWTHRDKYGRLDIKVGVAYGSDTEKLRDILLACAKEHREILAWPAPHVLFKEFGDSALNFELRAYVVDVENIIHVASDLNFAIDKAFRAAGIEMPFPHRDVTFRNIDALARAIAGERAGGAAAGDSKGAADGGASDDGAPDRR